MSVKKFKFISPGVFINEIDNSGVPNLTDAVGPVVIGRSAKGPALQPVRVNSFSEFIDIFGNPARGGSGRDLWYQGANVSAPTYGVYAAQAWLANSTPLTFVRLTGQTINGASGDTDAGVSGFAGWRTTNATTADSRETNGGAFGLWLVDGTSSMDFNDGTGLYDTEVGTIDAQGTLAAVFYLNSGSIELSGTDAAGDTGMTGSGQFFQAVDTSLQFKAIIKNGSAAVDADEVINTEFNFTPSSPQYIRKVFNTNPTLTNTNISTNSVNYWLGETYDGNLDTFKNGDSGVSGSVAATTWGIIWPLGVPDDSINGGNFRVSSTKNLNAHTGWFFGQDLTTDFENYKTTNMQKLFRFIAKRGYGDQIQNKVKISIQDLQVSPTDFDDYGTFTVLVRDIQDTDAAPIILERYDKCNLNPASDNYVARQMGDTYIEWDDGNRKYKTYGTHPGVSDYIYISMNEDVDRGATDARLLPFGVYGHPRYKGFANSGSLLTERDAGTNHNNIMTTSNTGTFVVTDSFAGKGLDFEFLATGSDDAGKGVSALWEFPKLRQRISSSEGYATSPQGAYFGADTTYKGTRFDKSVWDVLRTKADDISGINVDSDYTENAWIFSLDDIRNTAIDSQHDNDKYAANVCWESGSRAEGSSYTAHTASQGAGSGGYSTVSYTNILDSGFDKFTTCLHGGFDGLDITERDPFNNTRALSDSYTEVSSYAINSVKVAIDSLRDPEVVDYNLAAMPGLTNNVLNTALIRMCEDRGDALSIIDIPNVYTPSAENTDSNKDRVGTVTTAVNNVRNNLKLNTSYGATYYPWVQIRDTINGSTLWAPPSVAMYGVLAYSEKISDLWFAPAGFTRGGLTARNAAGIPVVGVTQKLTSKERDTLYEANINPIASFPAEGIVVFGQKTLQITHSALDRINVRRLVIYLKKEISRMAATLLFDQNVRSTWNRFKSSVEPFLANVKAGQGITEYRLILDETTTTPDLIDRNIMYAKVFIKPARAIEFIAIDFTITDSGAAFAD